MFKTISAALLAVSMLAAPAFAATAGKTVQAPVKSSVLNANAKMGKHHTSHVRHHRHHFKYAAKRTHHAKVGFRHSAHVTARRG
jgi:hypothetical protein